MYRQQRSVKNGYENSQGEHDCGFGPGQNLPVDSLPISDPHIMTIKPSPFLISAAICTLGFSLGHSADSTWNNTGTDFNAPGSWTAGVPGAGNQAIFNSAAVTNPNLSSSLSLGQLNFSTANASGYTISASPGQSFTLTTSPAIVSAANSGINTITANLILSGGGTRTFQQQGNGTLAITGNISEVSGSTTLSLVRISGGVNNPTFTLSGSNSHTGGTIMTTGTLNLGSATALGTGAFRTNGSTTTVNNSTAGSLTFANALELNNSNAVFTGSAMTFSGTVTLSGNPAGSERVIAVESSRLTLDGNITETNGSRPLTKAGAGILVLNGATLSYTGTTTVSAGTLLINGDASTSAGASVSANATLGGNGTVGGNTTVSNNAILTPGSEGVGKLTIESDLTFAGTDSKVTFELASGARGVAYDAVDVGNALTYNGDLTLTITSLLANGTYDLFSFTTQTGSFDSISFAGGFYTGPFVNNSGVWTATSGGQTFSFSQVTGDLVVVPEPSGWSFLVLGVAFLAFRWRRVLATR